MRLLRPIIWLISLFLVISLTRSVATLLQKRDVIHEQQEQLTRLQAENKRLTESLAQAETPEFIERAAREKLGLVKDGETVVILPQTSSEASSSVKSMVGEPNWKQWWGLFF